MHTGLDVDGDQCYTSSL